MELSAVLKKSIAMLKVYGNISEVSNGNSGSSKTISWASGQVQSITLNQNTTGSAARWTTARTLTIGSTGKTVDGSTNVSWSLAEIGARS